MLVVIIAATAVAASVCLRAFRRQAFRKVDNVANSVEARVAATDLWLRAVERVKEPRDQSLNTGVETPAELRHYSDRHWFLAAQVAEVQKFNVRSCQDFVDLAAMIERGDLVTLPAVTDTYILYGVGARADDGMFSRYIDDHNVELHDEGELQATYARLESARAKLHTEISSLRTQVAGSKKVDRARRAELQNEIGARERELKANAENRTLLDESYARPEDRQQLARDLDSLQTLAGNFAGRSFNLNDAADRRAMRVSMLSSLRPEALRILEEIAKDYHGKFARPLPVSSLVRPEQYQHALRKVNRNAVLIDTPPHSTGLAFDIDYRYMSGAEQTSLMAQLARLKNEGRIEVIRERNSNFHVFVFVDGKRPGDELIAASLKDATVAPKEAAPTPKAEAKMQRKTAKRSTAKVRNTFKSKARRS